MAGEKRIDKEELMEDAFDILKEQFWYDFSALCEAYLSAAQGLTEDPEMMFGEMTSIYGRSNKPDADDFFLNIYSVGVDGYTSSVSNIKSFLDYEFSERDEEFPTRSLVI